MNVAETPPQVYSIQIKLVLPGPCNRSGFGISGLGSSVLVLLHDVSPQTRQLSLLIARRLQSCSFCPVVFADLVVIISVTRLNDP